MKWRHGLVVNTFGAPCHEVEVEWNFVGIIETRFSIVICVQHLGDHYFCQDVLMNTARSLMDEDIVENFWKAVDAILEGNRRIQPEQRKIKIASCLVIWDYYWSLWALFFFVRVRVLCVTFCAIIACRVRFWWGRRWSLWLWWFLIFLLLIALDLIRW